MGANIQNKRKLASMSSLRTQSPQKQLPDKRAINLASVGMHPIVVKWAVLGTVLILLLAVVFGKFAVADRFEALQQAQQQTAAIREEVQDLYAQIDAYGTLADEYAHYTYSGMTDEELSRVSRVDAVDLMERIVLSQAVVSSWSIYDNELSIVIGQNTLQKINLIVQALEEDPMVDFCVVTNAATNTSLRNSGLSNGTGEKVTAKITVHLNSGMEEVE